ncbi:MAG: hypothetical protein P8012_06220 [Desulfobacterales bacterium]
MICSPCKYCYRKDLPKEKCAKDCHILKAIQEVDSSLEKLNDGCGIDYTEEYDYNIPPSLISSYC